MTDRAPINRRAAIGVVLADARGASAFATASDEVSTIIIHLSGACLAPACPAGRAAIRTRDVHPVRGYSPRSENYHRAGVMRTAAEISLPNQAAPFVTSRTDNRPVAR